MNNLPNDIQYCMDFSNEEIIDLLVKPLRNLGFDIRLLSPEEEELNDATSEVIRWVNLDGDIGDFFITLFKIQVSIFMHNQKFMFVDDFAKNSLRIGDTMGNVVYEGYLRDKTHEEIFDLIIRIVKIIRNSTNIKIAEERYSSSCYKYHRCNYKVLVKNAAFKDEIYIENIIFASY